MKSFDLKGSKEWAKSIRKVGLLADSDLESIIIGLDKVGFNEEHFYNSFLIKTFHFNKIYEEWNTNTFVIKENDEDIHTANERRLLVSLKLYE